MHIECMTLPKDVIPAIKRNFTIATVAGRRAEEEEANRPWLLLPLRAGAAAPAAGAAPLPVPRLLLPLPKVQEGRSQAAAKKSQNRGSRSESKIDYSSAVTHDSWPRCSSSASAIPGSGYAGNRHNIGFMAVDRIAADYGFSRPSQKFGGALCEGTIGRHESLRFQAACLHESSGGPAS